MDSDDLYKTIYSTKQALDKKLRIDLACIKESIEDENVKVEWVHGDNMIANCLTKAGASTKDLLHMLEGGTLGFARDWIPYVTDKRLGRTQKIIHTLVYGSLNVVYGQ